MAGGAPSSFKIKCCFNAHEYQKVVSAEGSRQFPTEAIPKKTANDI